MPYLTVYTNSKVDNGAKLAEELSHLTATVLGKPESYVVTNVIHNSQMSFGGSSKNLGALVELISIGINNKDRFVAEVTEFLSKNLSIKEKQFIAMSLNDAPAKYTACAGNTFA